MQVLYHGVGPAAGGVRFDRCFVQNVYDLDDDPEEACNRFFDPACTDVKLEMLSRLTDRMAFTADPLPERRARW